MKKFMFHSGLVLADHTHRLCFQRKTLSCKIILPSFKYYAQAERLSDSNKASVRWAGRNFSLG